MTTVTIYKSPEGNYTGLSVSGHAEYADSGKDIVCAAVSLLTINTINAIGRFTKDGITVEEEDENNGLIVCRLKECSKETALLMQTFEMRSRS